MSRSPEPLEPVARVLGGPPGGPSDGASSGPSDGTSGGPSIRPLVIGCGALARELVSLTRAVGLPAVDLTCLPATLHNRPERIPGAVRERIRRARANGADRIVVAYADCGTGGALDRVLEEEGVERLAGAHCYEFYAGRAAFAGLQAEEPGTFYLTDFLARNWERLVWRGLGLDRHPELLPAYFGNYRRLVYLAQTDDDSLTATARRCAARLGLAFERRATGLGELGPAVAAFAAARPGARARRGSRPAGAGDRAASFGTADRAPATGGVRPSGRMDGGGARSRTPRQVASDVRVGAGPGSGAPHPTGSPGRVARTRPAGIAGFAAGTRATNGTGAAGATWPSALQPRGAR